ncbi:kinase-like protein [Rhizopogon vinicolor AM-OR11-026]|uniref:Kinase-like protein n=1 Tax=Rhizopogon vinicolor AM-OR11-026 TaxID=1314800 RepID=A0A1B7MRG5_9AGAM|nr:kinase-like protein [Rhizopogon vinicolor AM-OR11-026]
MVLQSNAQHQQSVHRIPVPLDSATTFRHASESVNHDAPCSGTSVFHTQRLMTFPDEFTSTFPRTPPNSRPFFPTPGVFNSQTPASHAKLPRLDTKDHQSTLGHPPITPVSPPCLFPSEKNAAHCQHHIPAVVQGHLSDTLHEPTHLSPGRADLRNESPLFSPGQPNTSASHDVTLISPMLVDDDSCKHELASWKGDPSATLPTPVSPLPKDTGSPVTPIQAIDLTNWISRSYGLDPVAGGAFGNVWKCTYNDGFRCIAVAVKGFRFKVDKQTWQRLRREMGIWRRLNHPNVMEFMGIAFGFGLTIALVAPWAENGTLTNHLEKRWSTITSIEQLNVLDDIASGLSYLHSYPNNPITHGDLTGSNVLILRNMTACIADFGLSSMLGDLQTGMTYLGAITMYPGAVRWTAPELLESDDLQPTTLSDIYSLGSIMLQVLSGKVPWHEIKREVLIIRKIHLGHTPPCPSPQSLLVDELWPFISQCWSLSPEERPTAGNALEFIRRLRVSLHPTPVENHDTPGVTVTVARSASGPSSLKRPRLKIIT